MEPVNFNAPSQVVIAGHREAVERAVTAAKARGAKRAVLLPVSAPFHSSLLKPAAERLAARLADVPVAAPAASRCCTTSTCGSGPRPTAFARALAQQAASPVRWVETIQALAARGVTHVVECGPGKVLAGLDQAHRAPTWRSYALTDSAAIDATLAEIGAAHG